MYCRHCGKQIADDAKFCPECGESTGAAPSASSSQERRVPTLEEPVKKKKPIYKRVWFWILIIFLIIIVYLFGFIARKGQQIIAEQTIQDANARAEYAEQVAEDMLNGGDGSSVPTPTLNNPSNKTEPEPAKEAVAVAADDGIIDVDIDNCNVKYLSHELVVNLEGKTCLAVYFQFTNNGNEPKAFDLTVMDKAYQDGVELHFSWFHVNDASKDAELQIQPGVSIVVCSGFELRNELSSIELTVSPLFSLDNKPADSMILDISEL